VKKGKIGFGRQEVETDVPDGIIARLTRECGGKVDDHQIVEVTWGSFEKETQGANPHSGALNNDPNSAAKNAIDLQTVLTPPPKAIQVTVTTTINPLNINSLTSNIFCLLLFYTGIINS
jgi:hypothetical protein